MKRKRRAYTLVELLVVVAVLGVLVAMAMANYGNVRIRALVAEANAEMRTLESAVYAYQSDHGECPVTQGAFQPSMMERLRGLTSPIAYLSALPRDPFQPLRDPYWRPYVNAKSPQRDWDGLYVYNTAAAINGGIQHSGSLEQQSGWSFTSAGPDRTIRFPYYYYGPSFAINQYHLNFVYDPTNGTRSAGEIFRRGGQVNTKS